MLGRPLRTGYLLTGALGWTFVYPTAAGPPRPASADEIKEMLTGAGSSEDYDGADIVVVLDEADVFVQSSGLATTKSCQVIKLLTDAGVRSQSVQRFDFDPATRRVAIESGRIHRQDGTIEEVPLSDLVKQPTVQNMIYWGGEQHLLGMPKLDVGDAIELRVSKIGFNIAYLGGSPTGASGGGDEETLKPPMPGHWYEVTHFQADHPILSKRYSVHMPKDMPVQYEVYNGDLKSSLWFDGDRHVYTWQVTDVPAVKSEPHMASLDDCVAKLVIATVPDWETKSRWFHNVNEPQFEADEAIRSTVADITAGLSDLNEKIAACNHWVADNIRYCGTSRGPCEGFTLHRGIETFRDRAGVCKDKAGMLVTMLRVLGVEAYPALTMAGSRVEDIPADQFNHTVTVMREKDGVFRILDPTWIPLSREMWSSREALQGLVYGTPEGQTLTLSPYYDPQYNRMICRSNASIDEKGQLRARLTMDLTGYPCTYLRRNIERHRRPELRAAFEEALNIAPNARLERFEFTDPYDYSQDSRVEMEVTADRYAAGEGSVRMLRLPLTSHPLADWLIPDLFYPVDEEERSYAYRLRATRVVKYEETIELPEGWRIERCPDDVELDSETATLKFTTERSSGGLACSLEMVLKTHEVPSDGYVKFKETLEKFHALSDKWIVCELGDDQMAATAEPSSGHSVEEGGS